MKSDNLQHLRDVIGDIADSYIPDPKMRREMVADLTLAIDETCGQEIQQLRRWLRAVSLGRATKDIHAEIRAYLAEEAS